MTTAALQARIAVRTKHRQSIAHLQRMLVLDVARTLRGGKSLRRTRARRKRVRIAAAAVS